MGLSLFQWCPVIGQVAMGTNENTGGFFELKEKLNCFEGGRAMDQVAQLGYGVSYSGEFQNPFGCVPMQYDVDEPALTRRLD